MNVAVEQIQMASFTFSNWLVGKRGLAIPTWLEYDPLVWENCEGTFFTPGYSVLKHSSERVYEVTKKRL